MQRFILKAKILYIKKIIKKYIECFLSKNRYFNKNFLNKIMLKIKFNLRSLFDIFYVSYNLLVIETDIKKIISDKNEIY